MLSDPRDPGAYRIAIAALGLAVAVVLAGICWISAVHTGGDTVQIHKTTVHVNKKDPVHDEKVTVHVEKAPAHIEMGHVPVELWFALGALGGVLVGALIPFSLRVRSSKPGCACRPDVYEPTWWSIGGALFLLVLLVTCIAAAMWDQPFWFYAIDATIAGVLLGLPIPSLGRRDP